MVLWTHTRGAYVTISNNGNMMHFIQKHRILKQKTCLDIFGSSTLICNKMNTASQFWLCFPKKKRPLRTVRAGCLAFEFFDWCVCVIQHSFCPRLTSALDTHGTIFGCGGLCAHTHNIQLSRAVPVVCRSQLVQVGLSTCWGTCLCCGETCLHNHFVTFLLCLPTGQTGCACPQHSDCACRQQADVARPQQFTAGRYIIL